MSAQNGGQAFQTLNILQSPISTCSSKINAQPNFEAECELTNVTSERSMKLDEFESTHAHDFFSTQDDT
jgi:hypothetical protein